MKNLLSVVAILFVFNLYGQGADDFYKLLPKCLNKDVGTPSFDKFIKLMVADSLNYSNSTGVTGAVVVFDNKTVDTSLAFSSDIRFHLKPDDKIEIISITEYYKKCDAKKEYRKKIKEVSNSRFTQKKYKVENESKALSGNGIDFYDNDWHVGYVFLFEGGIINSTFYFKPSSK